MAKNPANYPASLDVLDTDRVAGQVVTSDSYDIIESAITQIEAELRRVTAKSSSGILTPSEGGLIKVSAVAGYTLYLPTAVGNTGLEYVILKTDENANLITIDADETETINGETTYTGLDYQWACASFKSDGANWIVRTKGFDAKGTWTIGISFGGGVTGITYTANTGYYTKVGNLVTITGTLTLSSKGSDTGSAKITGLPFTVKNDNAAYAGVALQFNKITFTNQFMGYTDINTKTIVLQEIIEAGNLTPLDNTNFADNSSLIIGCTYRAA